MLDILTNADGNLIKYLLIFVCLIALLTIIAVIIIKYLIFVLKCNIHAQIISEKIDEVLQARKIGESEEE